MAKQFFLAAIIPDFWILYWFGVQETFLIITVENIWSGATTLYILLNTYWMVSENFDALV